MARTTSEGEGDTRSRLIEAAIAAIDEVGEANVRVRDLSRRVNVAPTSIYHFFGSREGLIDEASAEWYRRTYFGSNHDSVVVATSNMASRDDVRRFLVGIVEQYDTPEGIERRRIRRSVLGLAMVRPSLAARVSVINRNYARMVAEMLAPAQRNGWLRSDIDVETAAAWQIAQMATRAVAEMAGSEVDLRAYERFEIDAMLAAFMGEAPGERRRTE